MASEIIGEVVGGIVRIIGQFLIEIVFEVFVRGAGYLLCRPFNRNIDTEGFTVAAVGFAFWGVVAFGGYYFYKHF